MSNTLTTIAFIGLGNMGGGMAANLAKKGFIVNAFDLMPEHLEKARADGCNTFGSAADAVATCDAVVSMLPNGKIVESLYIDQDALLDAMPKGTLVIDCSTVAPENSRRLAQVGTEKGMRVIDAPVSGGVAAAAAGTLAFMCGGSEADVDAARPVLAAMGANIFRAGDHGAGQVAKVCNNMLLAIHMAGTAEALQLGVNNGLDPKVLSDIMLKSSGCNWSLEKYNPYPGVQENSAATRGYTGGFMVDLMLKDLGLAMQSALASQSSIPMGASARNLFSLHKKSGGEDKGGLDFSSIQQFYQ
ncbi:3-hydroxyisobutyrate dehydrogenase [Simiduia aestuariiviva]|uniref:3-hydroxyisobutyrate dehydrogenase n=1 Tax=Simiduia aestuariiviva TaxID=1510459 RepID=A0A839UP55_9GAMM|nr:3-hydroxyisobutyrate dehydrogenase [Simiduia aestuariiviva]MBB3169622.1 3-hydroxyisobutyrate dehydrogenase [Simiduia aestuariiviva]